MATKTLTQVFSEIADAIRAKTESSETFTPEEMAAAIEAIQGGLWNSDSGTYYLASGLIKELPERLSGGYYFQLNDPSQPLEVLYNKVIIDGAGASEGVYYSASAEVRDKIETGIIQDGTWYTEQGAYNYDASGISKLTDGYYSILYGDLSKVYLDDYGVYLVNSGLVPFTGVANNGSSEDKGIYNLAYQGAEPERLSQNMVYDIDDNSDIRGSQELTANNLYIFDPGFSTGSSFRPANNVVIDDGDVAEPGIYKWNIDADDPIEKLVDAVIHNGVKANSGFYEWDANDGIVVGPFDNTVIQNGYRADSGVYEYVNAEVRYLDPGLYYVSFDFASQIAMDAYTLVYSVGGEFESVKAQDIVGEPFYLQYSGEGPRYKVLVTLDE